MHAGTSNGSSFSRRNILSSPEDFTIFLSFEKSSFREYFFS
jgi:hypothetical protein